MKLEKEHTSDDGRHRPLPRPGQQDFDYGVILCGGGPAALGPLIAAAKADTLDELMSMGVLVLEKESLGGGSLAHYEITANSIGWAFLRCFDGLAGREFGEVKLHSHVRELQRFADEHPPLPVVGRSLNVLGGILTETLSNHPRCRVCLGASVEEIRCLPGGGVEVSASESQVAGGRRIVATGRRAIVAMGGEPARLPEKTAQLLNTKGLSQVPTYHSDDFIDTRSGARERLAEAARAARHITIIGGSHSAWTVLGMLQGNAEFRASGGPPRVTLLHRSPIRLYYTNSDQARAEGYPFDQDRDRCPLTGRINRFGGLRGDARTLARSVLRGDPQVAPVRLVALSNTTEVNGLTAATSGSGMIVSATGHQARVPRLRAANGGTVTPAVSEFGTVTTGAAELVDVNGAIYPDIITYGLGAGAVAGHAIGGEPSYKRRAVGVWLFQDRTGRTIAQTLLSR
jgi:hypothetical protein